MAKIRTLKPSFFRSPSLAKCTRDARLTFEGLWTEADDAGYGLADARVLKGALWPYDDDVAHTDVEDHLQQIAREKMIVLYEIDSVRYYACINWEKHQSAAFRRSGAQFPPPPEELLSQACTGNGVQPAIPGMRESASLGREGKGREARAGAQALEEDFEKTWPKYPRKHAKRAALRAYTATRRKGVSGKDLYQATVAFAEQMAAEDRPQNMIKHGATFYGPDEHWKDFLPGDDAPVQPYRRSGKVPMR